MNVLATPGLLTDAQDASSNGTQLADLARHGWRWLSFQAQNDTLVRDFDLGAARAAGASPGVWGVTYDRAHFFRDGKALGQQAVKLGAEHVQMDCEFAAKSTQGDRGMKPIVDGLREGGWQGPVWLNTLGAPSNPRTAQNPSGNDYGMDVQSFLDTGGGVICQAYLNENDTLDPALCVAYWLAVGVPRDRLNVMIELAHAPQDAQFPSRRFSGAEWLPHLNRAGVKGNVSVFMWQHAEPADLDALDQLTLAPAPKPAETKPKATKPVATKPVLTSAQTRKAIADAAIAWETGLKKKDRRARNTICRRIAGPDNTDARWGTLIDGVPVSQQIADLLDQAGIPE